MNAEAKITKAADSTTLNPLKAALFLDGDGALAGDSEIGAGVTAGGEVEGEGGATTVDGEGTGGVTTGGD